MTEHPTKPTTVDLRNEEEAYLEARIQAIALRAHEEARPYVERLTQIRMAYGPVLTREQAEAAGFDWARLEGMVK
jgi:ApbE superfamily uncharacterized protein (UPF0280 family)